MMGQIVQFFNRLSHNSLLFSHIRANAPSSLACLAKDALLALGLLLHCYCFDFSFMCLRLLVCLHLL